MSVSHLAPSSTVPPVHHLRNLAITVGAVALAFALGIGAGLGLHSVTQTTEPGTAAQGAAAARAVPGVAENSMTEAVRAEQLALEARRLAGAVDVNPYTGFVTGPTKSAQSPVVNPYTGFVTGTTGR